MSGDAAVGTRVDYGAVVDALAGLVWITDADARSEHLNRRWREFTGLAAEQCLTHGWRAAVHPDDLASVSAGFDEIRAAGVASELEARLRRFDGEYRWFQLRLSPLAEEESREPRWCWLGIEQDESSTRPDRPLPEGRLRRFLDMLPTQVVFVTPSLEVEYVNRDVLDFFGQPLDDLQQWWVPGKLYHPDDLPGIYDQLENVRRGGSWDHQARMRRADGVFRWVRSRMLPSRDAQGNIVRYISCQEDVSDLKHAQDLLAGEVRLLEMVARGEPLLEVLDALSRLVEELSSGCFCSILLVTPDRQRFRVGAGPSLPDAYNAVLEGKTIDGGYGPCSLAVIEKTPIITADLVNDPRWEGSVWPSLMEDYGYASCWSMPILSGSGEPSGIFAIYRREPVSPTAEEQELIDRLTKIAGIAIDRAQADEALRTSETRLRRAHAHLAEGQRLSKVGSFTSDIRADEHELSDEFYRIFELDPDGPRNLQAVRDRVHPDDLAEFDGMIGRAMAGGDVTFAYRIVTPSDGLRHLRGVARVSEQVAGRPIFMGTVQDVTEARLAEAALIAGEAELRRANRQLVDAHTLSRTGSFTWDVLADEHVWTEEIYRLFEFDPAAKVGMEMLLGAVHPEDLPEVRRLLERALGETDFDLGFRVLPRSGVVKHARVVGRRNEQITDRPVFMGALQDVTTSKVAEEALNRARAELAHVGRVTTLSALTASIAHEVSQPLSGILTNANTCARMLAADPPDIQGAAETVRRTVRDANRTTDVIKRLRAMFANKTPVVERVDLNDAAREVIALSSSELQRSRVVLQTHFADGLPPVHGDRVQIQQVILNLLLNAADAMADVEDRPRLLSVRTQYDDRGEVRLVVSDAGVGIDPQGLKKLFDPFYTTKSEGMGVGLSISRSIIESHEGRLWAAANDGPGATFAFGLPAQGGD